MHRKKAIFYFLFLLFVVGACSTKQETTNEGTLDNFNESGYPIVDEPITLEMMGQSSPLQPSWEKMGFFEIMNEKTNIDFRFRMSTSDEYQQKKQLAFASMELPDLFYAAELSPEEVVDYGSQGLLIPLEDLIEEYAPNFKKLMDEYPEIRPSITAPDGHIYALPGLETLNQSKNPIIWMNGIWLENLGIEEKPQTIDEFYELLVAFKEGDPNQNEEADEIPLTAASIGELRNVILPNFGIVQTDGIYEKDGQVEFAFIQEEYKTYLEFLAQLYEEELLDQQIFSHTWEQYVAKGSQNQAGIFPTWPIAMVGFEDPTEALNYPVLPAMTSETNEQKLVLEMSEIRRGRFAITSKNEHPEATMRWIDEVYSEEGSILSRLGVEGVTWEWIDGEGSSWRLLGRKVEYDTNECLHAPGAGSQVPMVISQELFAKEDNPTIHAINEQLAEEYLPHGRIPYPLVHFTVEEQSVANTLRPDINTYIEQMEAQFVSGAESLDNWDDYVKTLMDLGVEELVDIYQAAYERWEEAK